MTSFGMVIALTGGVMLGQQMASQTPVSAKPFDVKVTFTDAAAKELQMRGEQASATAEYFGMPKKTEMKHADHNGQIELGEDERATVTDGIAHFSAASIRQARMAWVEGDAQVLVKVVSGTGKENILACDRFRGPLDAAQADAVNLRCGLKSEQFATTLVRK